MKERRNCKGRKRWCPALQNHFTVLLSHCTGENEKVATLRDVSVPSCPQILFSFETSTATSFLDAAYECLQRSFPFFAPSIERVLLLASPKRSAADAPSPDAEAANRTKLVVCSPEVDVVPLDAFAVLSELAEKRLHWSIDVSVGCAKFTSSTDKNVNLRIPATPRAPAVETALGWLFPEALKHLQERRLSLLYHELRLISSPPRAICVLRVLEEALSAQHPKDRVWENVTRCLSPDDEEEMYMVTVGAAAKELGHASGPRVLDTIFDAYVSASDSSEPIATLLEWPHAVGASAT